MSQLNLVLLGPPGSGKGTQGERLREELKLPYWATGDILRAAVKEQTELGLKAKEFMDRGDLVTDELIIGMISERIDSAEAEGGFILDGFPRTIPQADALGEALERLGRELSAVLLIDVSDEEVVRRLSGRRVSAAGRVYHVDFNPPKQEGVCDVDGSELTIRDDDRPEVIRHRLTQYHEKTEPLVAYYEQRGKLRRIDGDRPPAEVTESVRQLLGTSLAKQAEDAG